MESEGRRETLLDLLSPLKLKPKQLQQLTASETKCGLFIASLEKGFILHADENDLAIICETDLLGERVQQRTRDKRKIVNSDTLIHVICGVENWAASGAFRSWRWSLWWFSYIKKIAVLMQNSYY